jgi:hypothetical protein
MQAVVRCTAVDMAAGKEMPKSGKDRICPEGFSRFLFTISSTRFIIFQRAGTL